MVRASAMTLAEYIKREQITQRSLAKSAGVSESLVRHIMTGRKRPSLDTMIRLSKATNGEVTPNDFAIEAAA